MSPISSSRSLDEAPRAASAQNVGAALGQIIALAEAEAEQVRAEARDQARTILAAAHGAAETTRTETDRYVVARRIAVGREADGIIERASTLADEIVARAERDADARSSEARLGYERLRAELEGLAARRDEVERLLHERTVLAERRTAMARHEANRFRAIQNSIRVAKTAGSEAGSDQALRPNTRPGGGGPAGDRAAQLRVEVEQAVARRDAIFEHLAELGRLLSSLAPTAGPQRSVRTRARQARLSAVPPGYRWTTAGRRSHADRGPVG